MRSGIVSTMWYGPEVPLSGADGPGIGGSESLSPCFFGATDWIKRRYAHMCVIKKSGNNKQGSVAWSFEQS